MPEAQVDRFMMKVYPDYLDKEGELEVMRRMSNVNYNESVESIITKEDIFDIRDEINKVTLSDSLERYIVELVFATRNPKDFGLNEEAKYVQFGASTRASISLHRASKAIAFFNKRDYVLPEDIKEVAQDILGHRIILNYEAEAEGVNTKQIIENILRKVNINKA